MSFLNKYFKKPIVPLLIINSSLNQVKCTELIRKIQKINYKQAKAIGLVIQVDNQMPVQIHKISQIIQQIKQRHALKVYGFCHGNISPQSYSMLSISDSIYTQPTSIFTLERGIRTFHTEQLLNKLGIKKQVFKSDPNLIGDMTDSFTSANTSQFINAKITQISQKIYEQSILNRKKITNKVLQSFPPEPLIGQQAIKRGYADHIGTYYDVFKTLYPQAQLKHIRIREKISTRTIEYLFASPIILILFLFKVFLKYSILVYLWIQHNKNKK